MNTFKNISFLLLIVALAACGPTTISTENNYEQVELPDGSIVKLNKNSSITFDSFDQERTVSLSGEAFFDVIESEKPFTVTTEIGSVSVLGTEFNVKSKGDEFDVEVQSGEVEVKASDDKQKIHRGQHASYKKGNNGLHLGKSEFKFEIWLSDLEFEFLKLGKELKKAGKAFEKDMNKAGKSVEKDLNKAAKSTEKETKKLGKQLEKGLKKIDK